MENHCHVGLCQDKETAERDGPLLARGIWCGCQPCVNYNFSDCLMKSEFGRYTQVYSKLAKNQHVSETRSMALEEFAQTLDKDQTRVVHASKTEWYIEGPYWLVKILGKAYQTTEDQVIAGQEVPKGYWLVPAQWYKLVQTSQRAYVLLKETIQLNVNSLVRLPEAIQFEPVKARKKTKAVAEPVRVQPARQAAQPQALTAPATPTPHWPSAAAREAVLLGRAEAQPDSLQPC